MGTAARSPDALRGSKLLQLSDTCAGHIDFPQVSRHIGLIRYHQIMTPIPIQGQAMVLRRTIDRCLHTDAQTSELSSHRRNHVQRVFQRQAIVD
jgi:hypothetical protein